MEKVSFRQAGVSSGYVDSVRECEQVYSPLTDEMFNLGQRIFDETKDSKFPLNPKEWVAWMRKMDFIAKPDHVIFGMPDKASEWWVSQVFEKFHKVLARHFDKRVYYAMNGKILDLANYDIPKYSELSQAQKSALDAGWTEAKANIRKFMQNNVVTERN